MPETFTTSREIEYQGKKYQTFTIPDEVLVEHLFAMDAVTGDMKKTSAMMAAMLGVPLPVVGKMGLKDFKSLESKLAPILKEVDDLTGEEGNGEAEAG